jgi:hypothetical protein
MSFHIELTVHNTTIIYMNLTNCWHTNNKLYANRIQLVNKEEMYDVKIGGWKSGDSVPLYLGLLCYIFLIINV